jgi:hypothetical protein
VLESFKRKLFFVWLLHPQFGRSSGLNVATKIISWKDRKFGRRLIGRGRFRISRRSLLYIIRCGQGAYET